MNISKPARCDLPVWENFVGPATLAVDGPLCVAVVVADCDGEPAVVCPDHVDDVTRLARDA